MELIDWIRIALAAIPAFYWIVCLVCNLSIGVIYAAKARSPSSLPIIGSVAGIVSILVQPFPLPDPKVLFCMIAILPDIAWGGLGILGTVLDRTFPSRLSRESPPAPGTDGNHH